MQKRFFGLRNSILFLTFLSTPYFIFYVIMGSFTPSLYGVVFAALVLACFIALMVSEMRDTSSSYSGRTRETGKARIVGNYIFMGFVYSFPCIYGFTNLAHQIIAEETLEPAIALNSKAPKKVSLFCPFQMAVTPLAKNGRQHSYCGTLEDSLTINRSSTFEGGKLVAVVSKQSFLGHSFGEIQKFNVSLLGDKLQKAIDGEATMPFCNQKAWTLPANASVYEWHNVDGSRVSEESYRNKVSEFEISLNGKKRYLYKMLVGIGGTVSHQSFILTNEPIAFIDLDALHKNANLTKLLLKELKEKTTPWALDQRAYITTEGVRGYTVYNLENDGLHKVCSSTKLSLQP